MPITTKKGGTRSYGSWIKWKGYGRGLVGGNLSNEIISGLAKMRRLGLLKAVKSDFAKRKIKQTADRYIDEVLDSFTSDISKKLFGGAIDIHKAIGKLPKPKGGWTLPGHKYTGPYNDLENQVRWDPETGEILEIYDSPTGRTDAIAMQHDVDYSICKDDKKCKNKADRKMVKYLDAVRTL